MTDKLKEAIEWLKEIRDLFMPKTRDAIDTVVAELDKPTPTLEQSDDKRLLFSAYLLHFLFYNPLKYKILLS